MGDKPTIRAEPNRPTYAFGPFRLDAGRHLLTREGIPVSLTVKACQVLTALVEERGHVIDKHKLMELVWPDSFVEEANLSHHIYALRKALGDDKNGNRFIETVPKRGYRFAMEVRELPEVAPERELRIVQESDRQSPGAKVIGNRTAGTEAEAVSSLKPLDQAEVEAVWASVAADSPAQIQRPGWLARPIWWSTAGLLGLMAAGGYLLWNRLAPPLSPSRREVIVPLTTLPGRESQPVLSPDGSRVAFTWSGSQEDNLDIYVKVVDAESQIRLTSNPAQDTSPAWSNDSRYIGFNRNTGPDSGFYVVPALGGSERQVAKALPTRANFRGRTVDWFPDGKSMAIVERDSVEEPFHICVVSIETGKKQRLISPDPPSTGVMALAVSPDGKTIAFTGFLDGTPDLTRRHMDLYVISSSGGAPRRLTSSDGGVVGFTWTPDSSEIIFARFSYKAGPTGFDMPFNLWKTTPLGHKQKVIPVQPSYAYLPNNPHLSRSNERLVFEQRWLGNTADIWRAEGPQPTSGRILPTKLIATTAAEQDPQFSPDGDRIAFTSFASGTLELWVSDREGQAPVRLTSLRSGRLNHPQWSPDGSYITFQAAGDIWTVASQGGSVQRLTSDSSEEILPSWSRDGKWIYFATDRSGSWQVRKVPWEGGSEIQVTSHGGAESCESFDGKYLYFTKYEGLPWTFALSSIWRMPVEGGEETRIIDKTSVGYWGLSREGVCFLNAEGDLPFAFEFLSFRDGSRRKFGSLEREPLWNSPSFTVSPDGKWILYTKRPNEESDLMLIENFEY
ncbi:MAG: winged helix-turn-helix domain-containing protein [Acidobacteriota bacterium]